MLAETICSAVSAAGLGIAAITAYRKRFLAATRIAAYSLVPVGLVMTGVVEWVSDLVFKPSTWVGVGILGLSWVLFMTSRAVERRAGVGGRKERKAAKQGRRETAVEPKASAPSLGQGRTGTQPAARPGAAQPAEDFSDIEAILKKHGI
ncbi:hypothetical protein H9Y04_23920 [Streptomyces sp. TRM66268-LWL]|uniref:Integral membrane protein n=1 Tax=Streptomyces polyasparticus TaxID=2767826 RepID=A0ABR7SJF3_9ACTN|nr:hypothetical protein [Streptomyces polyasparticus]MBC9715597.1 hypothetical protein [Streptomyces polyasparticus]